MTRYFAEKLCPNCEGKGCPNCDDTGAVEVEVSKEEFYRVDGAIWHD